MLLLSSSAREPHRKAGDGGILANDVRASAREPNRDREIRSWNPKPKKMSVPTGWWNAQL